MRFHLLVEFQNFLSHRFPRPVDRWDRRQQVPGAFVRLVGDVLFAFVAAALISLGILVYLASLVFAVSPLGENRG
jgi:hypothetical protein